MENKNKPSGINSWPEDDRPREKLLKKGAGALSNSELLAILLRTGTHGTSAIDLARTILKKFGTFRNMAHTDSRDWKDLKGLGGAKIAHIQAALEIGRRYRQDDVSTGKQKIASAKDVVDIVMPQLRDLKTEVFNPLNEKLNGSFKSAIGNEIFSLFPSAAAFSIWGPPG